MLDNNGFVIISENTEHTGRFFGQIDGTIMDSLVQDRIYRRIALMDYQGSCSDQNSPYSAAPGRSQPPRLLAWFGGQLAAWASVWLAMVPQPVAAWANYESGYMDPETEDGDDPSYAEEYEDAGGNGNGNNNGRNGGAVQYIPENRGDMSSTTVQSVSPLILSYV